MKATYFSLIFGALVVFTVLQPLTAQAQEFLPPEGEESAISFCFVDDFGYVWDLNLTGGAIGGSVNVLSPPDWSASGTRNGRDVMLRADNPNADNCASGLTDYFTYDCFVSPAGGGTYNLSCTWESFCGSDMVGSGTLNGTATRGACRAAPSAPGTDGPAMSPQVQASATLSGTQAVTSYPNPFESEATISFTLDERADVRLAVYDVLGREVAVLVDEAREAGAYHVRWSADASLPAGTYLYRLQAGSQTQAGQMMLVR